MLRSGGPDDRVDPGSPGPRGGAPPAIRTDPGPAGIATEDGDRLGSPGTTAGIADRLPGIPGAGGILPAGDARVDGMAWPVVGQTRTHAS